MGKIVRDRNVVDVPLPPQIPLEMAIRALSYHCAAEFHNLASILPGVYREQGGAVTV
jgi:hypothetical protein